MSRKLTRIGRRKITRVIGERLVVTMDERGITIRGLRKRHRLKTKHLSWQQIAVLDADTESLFHVAEHNAGTAELERMGATP